MFRFFFFEQYFLMQCYLENELTKILIHINGMNKMINHFHWPHIEISLTKFELFCYRTSVWQKFTFFHSINSHNAFEKSSHLNKYIYLYCSNYCNLNDFLDHSVIAIMNDEISFYDLLNRKFKRMRKWNFKLCTFWYQFLLILFNWHLNFDLSIRNLFKIRISNCSIDNKVVK